MKVSRRWDGAGLLVMGRRKWAVPACLLEIDRVCVCVHVGLTVTEIRASMSTASVVLDYLITARDGVLGAVGLDELVVASAGAAFALAHLPLLQAAQSDVFAQEDVECRVDVLEQVVADEEDAVESV